MKVKQLRTEYVQVWIRFQDACCWEREKIPKSLYHCQYCLSFSKCVLEGDRAEADENHSYFWMRQALPWQWDGWEVESPAVERGPEPCSLWNTPPTECDFEGPHSKISAMGPEFLAMLPSPSPPYSPFLTVTQLRSFSPHGGGRFSIGSSQTSLSSPGYRWCIQCPMSGLYSPYQKIFFPRCLTNEDIHYDVDENLWPKSTRQGLIKHIESSEEHYKLTFYCRPKVVFLIFFFLSNFFVI